MTYQEFISKIRQLDNRVARWMMGHFYIIFFEFVLVIIFFVFFFNMFKTFDLAAQVSATNAQEQLLLQQSINMDIVIVLMFLNSFWMLFMFNGMNRIRLLLKDISFSLSKRRHNA